MSCYGVIVITPMIKCEHCDVDAYYRLSIEDFNSAEVNNTDLCIKCIKLEAFNAISDFPATKFLKIEPLFSTLTASIPACDNHQF